jgi:toxin ParE1/3/4
LILLWLPRAIRNRDALIDRIATSNPRAAIRQGDKLERQIDLLRSHPKTGDPGRVARTRELVISKTPFIVIYRYKPRAHLIEIVHILHDAQRHSD